MDTPRPPRRDRTGRLQMDCPRCATTALVSWNRQQTVWWCRRCFHWFRLESRALVPIERPGRTVVAVRSAMSPWRLAEVPLAAGRLAWLVDPRQFRLMVLALIEWIGWGRVIAVGATALIALAVIGGSRLRGRPAPVIVLPSALEERVPLLVTAWATGDMDRLLRLTDPTLDRDLRRWLQKSPAPEHPPGSPPNKPNVEIVSISWRPQDAADVVVRVTTLEIPSRPFQFEHAQRWVRKQDAWYFQVDAKRTLAQRPRPVPNRSRSGTRRG